MRETSLFSREMRYSVSSIQTVCKLLARCDHFHVKYQQQSVRKFAKASQKPNFDWWGTKKKNRNINLKKFYAVMDPSAEEILAPYRASVKEQGDVVRALKTNGAPELDIMKAVAELKLRKKALQDKELTFVSDTDPFDRARMDDLLKRRFYIDQSFAIYGGVSGQFDFGPMGCAFKTNLINAWRNFFILAEQMLEVDCSILTPENVLKASGHVERFADWMIKDAKTGECFRLEHLIKAHLEKIMVGKDTSEEKRLDCEDIITKLNGMTIDDMREVLKKYNVTAPCGHELLEPMEFNLMFGTQIGPSGLAKAFLRPETAQGIFVNFKRLLAFNHEKLPFAAAQIGTAFRNEISPRSGLIRVREFTMAEIEHFCDPKDKSHQKFKYIKDEIMTLYSACNQMDGKSTEDMAIGDAVASGLVANETLGYFMARIQQFLLKVGVDRSKLRFRQHLSNEMAHYACDCWDAECLTSYGWIECVGCADRSAYDLTQHTKATGVRLVAELKLSEPKIVNVCEVVPMKPVIGSTFKKEGKNVLNRLANLTQDEIQELEKDINEKLGHELSMPDGGVVKITKDMVSIKRYEKTVHVEEFVPSVIEPSFGIGRVMYAIFEHNFKTREGDGRRTYFSLPPVVAPLKCSVLPLSGNDDFVPLVKQLSHDLTAVDVSHKVDDSGGSIGRRYARTDELAIPFGITIDFDSLKVPHSATLRERDSMGQVRINMNELPDVIRDLSNGKITWADVEAKYPKFEQQESTEAD